MLLGYSYRKSRLNGLINVLYGSQVLTVMVDLILNKAQKLVILSDAIMDSLFQTFL